MDKKLKQGEVIAKENAAGMVILKWHDNRDVLMISTSHTDEMSEMKNKFGKNVTKPQMVLAYNKGKSPIDTSDQMASYNTTLMRTVKWYHKVVIELIFGTILNSLVLYNKVNITKWSFTKFKEHIVNDLIKKDDIENHKKLTNSVKKKKNLIKLENIAEVATKSIQRN